MQILKPDYFLLSLSSAVTVGGGRVEQRDPGQAREEEADQERGRRRGLVSLSHMAQAHRHPKKKIMPALEMRGLERESQMCASSFDYFLLESYLRSHDLGGNLVIPALVLHVAFHLLHAANLTLAASSYAIVIVLYLALLSLSPFFFAPSHQNRRHAEQIRKDIPRIPPSLHVSG